MSPRVGRARQARCVQFSPHPHLEPRACPTRRGLRKTVALFVPPVTRPACEILARSVRRAARGSPRRRAALEGGQLSGCHGGDTTDGAAVNDAERGASYRRLM